MNVGDGEVRYVVAWQKRKLLDELVPFSYMPLYSLEGHMWAVCVAKTGSLDGLNLEKFDGHLYLFHNFSMWDGEVESLVQQAQSNLRRYRTDKPSTTLENYFDDQFLEFSQRLIGLSSFAARFSLKRNGELEIRVDGSMRLSDSAPSLGDSSEYEASLKHVCSQLFYFLKDICHRHQHHHPKTDTVVDLYPADDDDYRWRIETLYSLYRKIIHYKRIRDEKTLMSSLGVLAYAKSFEATCKKAIGDSDKRLPEYDSNALQLSIEAADSEVRTAAQLSAKASQAKQTIVIFIVGLVFSFMALLSQAGVRIEADAGWPLKKMANFLVEYPWSLFVIIPLVWLNWPKLVRSVEAANSKPVRWLARLFQPLNKYLNGTIFLILAALSFYLAIRIL